MKKQYMNPRMQVVTIKTAGMLAVSPASTIHKNSNDEVESVGGGGDYSDGEIL